MLGKTYQCQISNAGGWFIGVRFYKFHDFSMTFDDFSKFHHFFRKFYFSRFSRPCGNPADLTDDGIVYWRIKKKSLLTHICIPWPWWDNSLWLSDNIWHQWALSWSVQVNGLSPVWCQAITLTKADLLSMGPLAINFSEIWDKIKSFLWKRY